MEKIASSMEENDNASTHIAKAMAALMRTLGLPDMIRCQEDILSVIDCYVRKIFLSFF